MRFEESDCICKPVDRREEWPKDQHVISSYKTVEDSVQTLLFADYFQPELSCHDWD